MGIDVDDLRKRIARVRSGQTVAVAPRAADDVMVIEVEAPRAKSFMKRAYDFPVVGRVARAAAAIWNLPNILANLSRHYADYHAEIGRLTMLTNELRAQVDATARSTQRAEAQVARLAARLEAMSAKSSAAAAPAEANVPGTERLTCRRGSG